MYAKPKPSDKPILAWPTSADGDVAKQRSPAHYSSDDLRQIRASRERGRLFLLRHDQPFPADISIELLYLSRCISCQDATLWVNDDIVVPAGVLSILPNPDMPPPAKETFEEAARVLTISPRAACALARLSVEQLCDALSVEGRDLNERIGKVGQRLGQRVQKAMDVVRLTGNDAVHSRREIQDSDSAEMALHIMKLLNVIVDSMVTHERHLDNLFKNMPEAKKRQIEDRDARLTGKPQS